MALFRHRGIEFSLWFGIGLIILLVLSIPLLSILFQVNTEIFSGFVKAASSDYTLNTAILLVGTALLATSIGVSMAWITTYFDFPLKKAINVLLMLPLAFPAYIMAFTYKGMLGLFGSLHSLAGIYVEIDNLVGAIFVFSLSLYPYVYLAAKVSFSLSSARYFQAAQSLGSTKLSGFLRVVLPMSWPAIFGGMLLVIMEVLNNYGAVQYFGIPTFTTEIVRLWNPIDNQGVTNIAGMLVLWVVILLGLERLVRGKAGFQESNVQVMPSAGVYSKNAWWLALFCSVPILFGFLIPSVQLFVWTFGKWTAFFDVEMLTVLQTTFVVGLGSAMLISIIALLIRFLQEIAVYHKIMAFLSKTVQLGYSIPGALLGIGMLSMIFWLNQYFVLALTASLFTLVLAYMVRFYGVAMSSLHGGFEKLGSNISRASLSLGKSIFPTFRMNAFILKRAVLAAVVLVFVDVIKELPLTMMFQRFNFETLAVRAYKLMITDGAIYDAALPSLLIVAISAVPVLFMNKIIDLK